MGKCRGGIGREDANTKEVWKEKGRDWGDANTKESGKCMGGMGDANTKEVWKGYL